MKRTITIKHVCISAVKVVAILAACYLAGYGIGRGVRYIKNCKMKQIVYPQTERESVTDNYHGTVVADPYRWLEDDRSERTAAWVKAQNEVTFGYLNALPQREAIRKRLTELWDYPSQSAPAKRGEWYYISRNSGLQNQSVLYRKRSLEATEEEVFFDPNTLSEDGTVALHAGSFTKDGRYYAYALASAGSDWVEIRVLDTETMKPLDDHIKWVKFSGAGWTRDGRGFYYSAYDAPKEGDALYSAQNTNQKVYFHRLGTSQEEDVLIFEDKKNPLHYHHGGESEDGRWQFITSSAGTSGTQLLYKRTEERKWRTLFKGFEYDYMLLDCYEDEALVMTNDKAANYRLVGIDLTTGKQHDIIPEGKSLLEAVGMAGRYLFAEYLIDAQSRIFQYDREGNLVREVELPIIGSVGGFDGEREDTEVYYAVANYTTPGTIYRYDIESGRSELYHRAEVKFDSEQFETEQLFFDSKDGTRVPMFVSHKKGMKLDGSNPCYLYGYGGFQINLTPSFSSTAVMFMEQGGVWCVVNLRGGSEYGEEWHKGGMLKNKQNVFDDFIAAAEHLIAKGYTSSKKLAIAGGSNGGLLVGACMTQRPDLYAVALPAVGVLDMLRYHRFTIGHGWVVEYGSADNKEQFDYLIKYSPLHNLREGVEYPATLVTTGDHDDRVVPAHSFKFAAELQHCHAGNRPVLIRIDTNAGHGAGKPTSKRIEETADIFAFIFENTATEYKE
ncbi:MAG: S9 family peptidase [Alistipes sp.]|nr:S9 family peptidase [Alistipes sp.]